MRSVTCLAIVLAISCACASSSYTPDLDEAVDELLNLVELECPADRRGPKCDSYNALVKVGGGRCESNRDCFSNGTCILSRCSCKSSHVGRYCEYARTWGVVPL